MSVDVVNWNPSRPVLPGRLGRKVPWKRPVDNFGDLLGPLIVDRLRELGDATRAAGSTRLLSVGSVMHLARTGDVVWGTGVNGKVRADEHTFDGLDVRAVRGPRTRQFLTDRGIAVPEVYGDPGLLVPTLWPHLRDLPRRRDLLVVPNFRESSRWPRRGHMDPRRPLWRVVSAIASSRFVVGSSLHGIIVADAFGVPARLIASGTENPLKYEDYFLGTGRTGCEPAATVAEAMTMGPHEPCTWDPVDLIAAFPWDLWDVPAPTSLLGRRIA